MSDGHLKRLALVVALVLPILAAWVYLSAKPLSPTPAAPSGGAVATPNPVPAGAASSTQPKITWSQNQIEVILSPGESTSKDLTFTISLDLQNIVIDAVPEIAGFLSLQPNGFANVPAGQPQSVHISFRIPEGTVLGTYKGTIHVRSGSQTLPQTLKVVLNVGVSAEDLLKMKLEKLMSPVGVIVGADITAQGKLPSEEIRLRWETPGSATTTPVPQLDSFTILERRKYDSPMPTFRSVELAADKLLVVAVDTQSRLKGWTIIPDPRVLRTEAPGPDGVLRGQIVFQADPEFSVLVPDDPTVTEVRLYLPHWTGQDFVLTQLGTVVLR